ncbi:hypothetical protein [Microvirga massiliensis]|nr:hypothetical protein [Microvirga massiliensis]
MSALLDLPLASLDRFAIGTRLREVGHLEGANTDATTENAPPSK